MAADLNNHHRTTRDAIFNHPTSGNVDWHAVLSLLEAVGSVTEEHNGQFKVTLGSETEMLRAPHDKDVDKQMVVDLRRMLAGAGFGPHSGS